MLSSAQSVTNTPVIKAPKHHSGFTLLEILVVMVIIAFMAGIAVMSVGGDDGDDAMKLEARRLTELIKLASEQAVMHGKEVGIEVAADGYRFLVLQNRRWQAVNDEPEFRERNLEAPLELNIALDADAKELFGRALTRKREDEDEEKDGKLAAQPEEEAEEPADAPRPQIFILSSGEISPFALGLGYEEGERPRFWRIRVLEDGQVRLDGPHEGSLRLDLKLDAGAEDEEEATEEEEADA